MRIANRKKMIKSKKTIKHINTRMINITQYKDKCNNCNTKNATFVVGINRDRTANAVCKSCNFVVKAPTSTPCRDVRIGAATYKVPDMYFRPETITINSNDNRIVDVIRFIADNADTIGYADLVELAYVYGFNADSNEESNDNT